MALFYGAYMKLRFKEDKFVDGVLTFKAGEIYDIPEAGGSAVRWLKRGAEVVEETPVAPEVKAEVVEAEPEVESKVVNEEVKKENRKGKQSSKQG